jgi:polysaccharide biosynthesis protein PslH
MQAIKIMSLVWYKVLPAHFGGQKGIANFNEALGKHFSLLCLCNRDNEPGSEMHYQVFNLLPVSKLQIINPFVWFSVIRFAFIHKVTHVILEHPYHVIPAILLKISGKTIITHSHNIEFERLKLTGKKGWKWIYLLEKTAYKFSDLTLFKTTADRETAIERFSLNRERTMLIPYGVDKKDIEKKTFAKDIIQKRHNIQLHHKVLLFNGTLDYAPNAEAVVNITKHLIPQLRKTRMEFSVIVTGRLTDENYGYIRNLKARNFIFAGFVENVDEYFLAADVYINAVDEGGGIQTKTLEALSYQMPVVMFRHMSEGVDVDRAKGFIYLIERYDWRAFAQAVETASEQHHGSLFNDFFKAYSFDANLQPLITFITNTSK